MGTLLGLGFGVGLALVWMALTDTGPPRRRAQRRPGRLAELLHRSGVPGVSPGTLLVMSAIAFTVVTVLMLAVSRTVPVALVFGLIAAWLPVAVLRGRAARRARELGECWPEAVDNLASAVRAGLSLPEALGQVRVHL